MKTTLKWHRLPKVPKEGKQILMRVDYDLIFEFGYYDSGFKIGHKSTFYKLVVLPKAIIAWAYLKPIPKKLKEPQAPKASIAVEEAVKKMGRAIYPDGYMIQLENNQDTVERWTIKPLKKNLENADTVLTTR